jgi:hypothetical protein
MSVARPNVLDGWLIQAGRRQPIPSHETNCAAVTLAGLIAVWRLKIGVWRLGAG